MSTATPPPFTTLSQDASHILRLVQQRYATTLQHFTDRGCDQVALDADELQAFLRALPRVTVLAALALGADCEACGVCQVCTGCSCAAETARGLPAHETVCVVCGRDEAACRCAQDTEAATLGLDAVGDETPLPVVLTPQPWWRPTAGAPPVPTCGTVCACAAHAGVHLADEYCLTWRDPAARHSGRHNCADGARCGPACFGQSAWGLPADVADDTPLEPKYRHYQCPRCRHEQWMTPGADFVCQDCTYTYVVDAGTP